MATENVEVCILFTTSIALCLHLHCIFFVGSALLSQNIISFFSLLRSEWAIPMKQSEKETKQKKREAKKITRHNHLRGRINHEVIYVKPLITHVTINITFSVVFEHQTHQNNMAQGLTHTFGFKIYNCIDSLILVEYIEYDEVGYYFPGN